MPDGMSNEEEDFFFPITLSPPTEPKGCAPELPALDEEYHRNQASATDYYKSYKYVPLDVRAVNELQCRERQLREALAQLQAANEARDELENELSLVTADLGTFQDAVVKEAEARDRAERERDAYALSSKPLEEELERLRNQALNPKEGGNIWGQQNGVMWMAVCPQTILRLLSRLREVQSQGCSEKGGEK